MKVQKPIIPQIMLPYLQSQGIDEINIEYIVNPPRLNDKWQLHDIKKAVNLLLEADHIAIIGDYDFDGVSATTIAVLALSRIGKKLNWCVPNRFKDGYGLNVHLVDQAYNCGADTIFTVDNGIAAHDAIKHAKDLGLTVIVSDHHAISTLPQADAIIHPALGEYPFAGISGSQLMFKIAMALFETCHIVADALEEYFFQLSAISIVSDVMPLAGPDMEYNENRFWLNQGLELINKSPKKPLKVLIKQNGFSMVDEEVLGYYIVPCINAVGRLYDATYAVEYFLTADDEKLQSMCSNIIQINSERKDLVKKQMSENAPVYSPEGKAVFVIGDSIHEGIAGLIAGQHSSGKGTVSFCFTKATSEETGEVFYKGSGRNDTDISVIDMLNSLPEDLMIGYGGHKDACGLSVELSKMDDFVRYVSQYADANAHPNNVSIIDATIEDFNDICLFVQQFKPFGNGFALPTVRMSLQVEEVMVTASGAVKIGFQKDSSSQTDGYIEMWLRESNDSFISFLAHQHDKKEFPSGTVKYNVHDAMADVIFEISYTYRKATNFRNAVLNSLQPSFNCVEIIV